MTKTEQELATFTPTHEQMVLNEGLTSEFETHAYTFPCTEAQYRVTQYGAMGYSERRHIQAMHHEAIPDVSMLYLTDEQVAIDFHEESRTLQNTVWIKRDDARKLAEAILEALNG